MENINKQAISDLSDLLKKNSLREIEYESDGVRIRVVAQDAYAAVAPAPVAAVVASASVAEKTPEIVSGTTIKSPMVGVIYLSAEPGTEHFVNVGDKVGVGQTLCLVEAMKTFNPVKATKAGTIKQILVENGAPVEFNEPLFVVE